MSQYRVSFTDEQGEIEAVVLQASSAADAQERAIDYWEERGIVHGDLCVAVANSPSSMDSACPQRRTNVEFVRDLMEFSPYGALVQAFVLEALSRYADQVADADPAQFDSALLSGHAWVGVARDIKAKIHLHLGG
jgi:hypothetical protein